MSGSGRRVVCTGIGIIAPGSGDAQTFWSNACAGAAVVDEIPEHWKLYYQPQSIHWAPLPERDWSDVPLSRVEAMQLDMTAKLAVAASWQAVRQAGLEPIPADEKKNTFSLSGTDPSRSGVFLGTGMGGACSFAANEGHHLYAPLQNMLKCASSPPPAAFPFVRCAPRFNPFAVPMSMPNGASAALGIKYSLTGRNQTVAGACAAGTMAIGAAFEAVRSGRLDLALAGGTEYLADEHGGIFRAFDSARTLATGHERQAVNRPFDHARSGFLFAEGGCAVLVLEPLETAQARGALPIAEIIGYAENFDAYSVMAIEPSGARIEAMLRQLLDLAGVAAEEIDYINSHGTGTMSNDDIEAAVIARIFGKGSVINATKSLIGHTIGAAGAIEAAVTALSIRHAKVHPCVNLLDPIADLDFATEQRDLAIRHAISHSFAFGGHNAALLFSSVR
ncbi:MAG: beta-ketoacyl-[acyl-carrier-protein] synthase family protein [Chitinispirillaceae bacterium]|nr:beta-ketoacyl-[acyl-carrier-protein] synthase family protein [Chitinispirillaceae bacterium]